MESDEVLVERAKTAAPGDLRDFELLIARHQEKILANCRYLTGAPDDAQDLAQEVFVKAFFGLAGFEGRASFGSWIKRIKVNHVLNFIRSKKKRSFIDIDDPETEVEEALRVEPQAERATEARDERERIREALDAMPEKLRLPLIMRELDEMSYDEIAAALDLGLSAVKMRIKRGRETFRKLYGDFDRQDPKPELSAPPVGEESQ